MDHLKAIGGYSFLFGEQVVLMSLKHISQKRRAGRQFLKETFMIPLFLLGFTTFILYSASQTTPSTDVYERHSLPPLSSASPWGIFNQNSNGNNQDTVTSKTLYYSPNNHAGVNALIDSLVTTYPSIKAIGAPTPDDVNDLYAENLFDTWAAIEFSLSNEQISSGLLVTSLTQTSTVSYAIRISPINWGYVLPSENFTTEVYNKQQATADLFWATGYMTLENFVSVYLATQYPTVAPDFTVDTFVQRYPTSPIYENNAEVNIRTIRNAIWKWIGATILSVCLFVPMLSLLTEIVRERQFRMKDLLEISGLMNAPYWVSYLAVIFLVCQITTWFSVALLFAFGVLNEPRLTAYGALLTCYIWGSAAFGMSFGFVVPRSEYYGLPVFMLNTALTVAGAFLGIAYNISVGAKLFICFLSPSIGLTMGILSIETYLYDNENSSAMDYNYVNEGKAYPSLGGIVGVLVASSVAYTLFAVGMPYDWVWDSSAFGGSSPAEHYIANRNDEVKYPCDNEEEELEAERAASGDKGKGSGTVAASSSGARALLSVCNISHIYPDGTHAVKDMSFNVKEGEVLSFLGSNGAGKSTCMGMLCGTLEATFGDAIVNGFSISTQRVMARRNLGIAMQQDIIWDDVNVEDHLMLFGRLRGLHGKTLREHVDSMAVSLGFPDKRKSLAGTLSGGQKRRLCVGLSMVGGNSVVYLDEPTAGLDPVSRRQLWELVQRNRAGRAILLTTHFMDEADVLGDRIAVVKEGRLRALGTAKFLKNRFGLGYLLRMSLSEGADAEAVQRRVRSFVSESTLASSAGTELSIRLPREAVPRFPEVFETLEEENKDLGVQSYGIETTTLEEVFMRIVNEDNELLLMDHTEANRLLGTADREEREQLAKRLEERDNKRRPLRDEDIESLLVKGRGGKSAQEMHADFLMDLVPQALVMLDKRFHQFVRSRGQWMMGAVIPFGIAILVGVILATMPSQLLEGSNPTTPTYFYSYYPVLTAGASAAGTQQSVTEAFGSLAAGSTYLGNYTELYDYVDAISSAGMGASSTTGVAYEPLTAQTNNLANFTVLYNASYPMNFAGAVNRLLGAAVSEVTNDMLVVEEQFGTLPFNQLGKQLNNGFYVAIMVSLLAGSFGAGLSIVVSGERVGGVKHQQFASGASAVSYWLGNFLFDFLLMFVILLVFCTVLVLFLPSRYSGSNFGYLFLAGLCFIVSMIFRFYAFSYAIGDVRLAQSIYFYGSLIMVFVLIDIWFNILFVTASGDVSNSSVALLGAIFSLIDPAFGFYVIILFLNNFLGILAQNSDEAFESDKIAGLYLDMLIVGVFLYAGIFILWVEGGFIGTLRAVLRVLFCGKDVLANPREAHHAVSREQQMVATVGAGAGAAGSGAGARKAGTAGKKSSALKTPLLMTEGVQAQQDGSMAAPSASSASASQPHENGAAAAVAGTESSEGDEDGASASASLSVRPVASTDRGEGEGEGEGEDDGRAVLGRPTMRVAGARDPDVAAEFEKVRTIAESGSIDATKHAIFIHNLRKVYYARGNVPAKVAVKDVSVCIPHGEIFGLLGANGAGKTTLLKMVSGQEAPTAGFALINGFDVERNTSAAQQSMGLCPQFDTLVERLSVRENLLFFGKIKGLSNQQLSSVAEAFMSALNIKRYEHKLIQQLSGGNRRKVSLAVALMGAPPTVYLDEPSTGLDPVASRLMWRLLSRISALKTTAIVLTTHNMLECEAVCTRICIMKLGEMVCLGDNQHLRSVHGTGFLLETSLAHPETAEATKKFVLNEFPQTTVLEEHSTMINFEIPRASLKKLSQAFRLMEENKAILGIVDYALSQSTLEQVFLKQIRPQDSDARNQEDQRAIDSKVPTAADYITGYAMWLAAGLLPGLHHFYLGNTWRGALYLCTLNEAFAGWFLDLFEMHTLIQKSVQEKGNVAGVCLCTCCVREGSCCARSCCCCFVASSIPSDAQGPPPQGNAGTVNPITGPNQV